MSSAATQRILDDPDRIRRNKRLVAKWQGQVSDEQRKQCAEILSFFGIRAYTADGYLPHKRYCHFLDPTRTEQTLVS
jgi:hypothetical protein